MALKILFIMRHDGYVRNYESVITMLAEKGYKIHLGFTPLANKVLENTKAKELIFKYPNITYSILPELPKNIWTNINSIGRILIDYMRYLHPRYAKSPKLRARSEKEVPRILKTIFKKIYFTRKLFFMNIFGKFLNVVEETIPTYKGIDSFFKIQGADIVLITPIVDYRSNLLDYLKSAKKLGYKTALCVASWDNLTNKGLIQIEPDAVFVWNEIQKNEAIKLHNIPAPKVSVTGAQLFDQWFEQRPSTTRQEFCLKAGIDKDKAFILYVCSSVFVAKNEVEFIRKWIGQLRKSYDLRLREIGIVIRPHPNNTRQWADVDFSSFSNVSIWPRFGAVPMFEETKKDYFDSLYYCSAVVGINTSALIEAGIVGKPVFTILAPEFKETQDGTLHFHYLVEGGLLYISEGFDEHINQLSKVLNEREDQGARKKRMDFIESFVRPHGLNKPCTPILTERIESLGFSKNINHLPISLWVYFLRIIIFIFAFPLWLYEEKLKHQKGTTDYSEPISEKTIDTEAMRYQAVGAPIPIVRKRTTKTTGAKIK